MHEHILAIDFAMFLLIWVVQLIIYPAFHQISVEQFSVWHAIYCKRIAFFVLPLMIFQIFESAAACFFIGGDWIWVKFFFILSAWISTFFISASCHQKLSKSGKDTIMITRLVSTNWYRTVLWTLILIISYLQY